MRLLTLVLVGLIACKPQPPEVPQPGVVESTGAVVFTVNNISVTEPMIDAITRRVPPDQLAQMKAQGQYTRFLQRMALGQVLYQKAIDQGLHEQADVQNALAMSDRETLATEMLNSIGEAAITDEAVQAMYEERAVQYARPQVNARHILVKEKALADDIAKQLREGADFAVLAKQYSVDPGSGKRGGELGWFGDDKMIKPFSEVAFNAEINTVSDPVETRFGFHIIEVLERREKTPVEDVRPQLEQELRKKAIEAYMKEVEGSLDFAMAGQAEDEKAPGAKKSELEPEVTPPAEAADVEKTEEAPKKEE